MSVDYQPYSTLSASAGYWLFVLLCCIAVLLGGYCAFQLEHQGHVISGMNNHVVWGLPHVFAVSLIVMASGALNAATFSSVFGVSTYKPTARLSIVLAMCTLIGGLVILVLDLGRPDRLVVAMTHFNFRSIFSWNIFLYTGFLLVCVLYLWMMMEKRFNRHVPVAGKLALGWRLVLTTGTGSIFGFLVGRNALDSALLAPLFIVLSLLMGLAFYILVLYLISCWRKQLITDALAGSLSRFLIWFLVGLAYFSIVQHVTNLYVAEHKHTEQFTLTGEFAGLFWIGHVVIGLVLPLSLLAFNVFTSTHKRLIVSAALSLLGSAVLLYVIIIGSQSTAQVLFPGKTIIASRFGDAGFAPYQASLWEWGLGFGGIGLALLLFMLALTVLPFLPDAQASPRALDDEMVD